MTVVLGDAVYRVRPDTRGFGRDLDGGVSRATTASSGRLASFAKRAGTLLAGGAAVGFGAFTKQSVTLEAQFGKTMSVLQATLTAPQRDMRTLQRLAMDMGASTVFSANDASQAMLELARGGLTTAAIKAGALEGTLTLAAAGELKMGEAANIAVKSMGQFNLGGDKMASVAAALAGGANASSASVRDMSQALAQGGLSANAVGFSLQETTGILAAFSNNGLEGSDAGTSLKTMLDRLVPSTRTAKEAMMDLGIVTSDGSNRFLKANGEYKSAAQIAQVLKTATDGLSSSERNRAITAMFGSDAQRAANILAKEGASGLVPLIKATSDKDAAERAAAANMRGTAGAMERMRGSVETTSLAWGQAIKPVTKFGANLIATIADKATPYIERFGGFLRRTLADVNVDQGVGKAFASIGAALAGIDWAKSGGGLTKIGDSIKSVNWSKFGDAFGAGLADTISVFAVAIGFAADHIDVLAKAMPYLVIGLVAFRVAQAAANIAALAGIIMRGFELLSYNRLAGSVKMLNATLISQGGAQAVATTAAGANATATNLATGATVRQRIAAIASSVAARAVAAATWVWTIAQRALNLAMRMNPIGMVITALVALGAGLVIAYKKSATFRSIVNRAWASIKDGISKAWNGVIRPVFTALSRFVTGTLMPILRRLWTGVVRPVFKAIGHGIRIAWGIVKIIFAAWKAYFTKILFPVVRQLWTGVVKPVFVGIRTGIRAAWGIIRGIFGAWKKYFDNVLFPVIRFLWAKVVRPVFNGLKRTISTVWNNGVKPVLAALGDFIREKVAPAFRKGVDRIKSVWETLKNALKAPIRFVVQTVINDGLIGGFNWIAKEVGAEKIDPVPLPKGFASGGVLPGYTPGRDVHHFASPTGGRLHLSGGEAIMRPEWTRAMGGPKEVARQNLAARRGQLHGPPAMSDRAQGFFLGGVMPLQAGVLTNNHGGGYYGSRFAGDLNGPLDLASPPAAIYAWKKGTVSGTEASASSYGNQVRVNHGAEWTRYAHLSSILARVGQQVAAGQTIGRVGNTGNSFGAHLHFEVHGGSQALNYAGATTTGAVQMPSWASKFLDGPLGYFRDKISDSLSALTSRFGNNAVTGMLKKVPNKLISAAADFLKDKVSGKFAGSLNGTVTDPGALATGPAQQQVKNVAKRYGWHVPPQWTALYELIQRESSWNPNAANPTSSARGLFQKMTSLHGPVEPTAAGQAIWGLNYIKCVPLDSLILTRRGWLTHSEVRVGDETLGFDPATGTSRWTPVTAVHHYDEAPVVTHRNARWGFRSTPNHRWLAQKRLQRPGGDVHVFDMPRADQIGTRHQVLLAAAAESDRKLPISDAEAELLGWILGDGSIYHGLNNRGGKRGKLNVTIAQAEACFLDELHELLQNFPHSCYRAQPNRWSRTQGYTFRLASPYARDLLARSGYEVDLIAMVLAMSDGQRARFLRGAMLAEGHFPENGSPIFTQNVGPKLEAVKVAGFMEGHYGHVTISGGEQQRHLTMGKGHVKGTKVDCSHVVHEPVWCVTTDLGSWTTMQDGNVMLTGNSRYGTPTAAIAFHNANNSYAGGGVLPNFDGTFDRGGVAHGRGFLPKATVAPERVLSPRQTDLHDRQTAALEQTAAAGGGGGRMELTITNWETGRGYFEFVAGNEYDARARLNSQYQAATRG